MSHTAAGVVAGVIVGLGTAWAITIPLYRFKELRPMTPREVATEGHLDIRAVQRHAACPRCHHLNAAREWPPLVSWIRGCPNCGLTTPRLLIAAQLGLPIALAINAIAFERVDHTIAYAALLVAYGAFAVLATAVAVVDARVWLIPWWIPWIGAAAGLVLLGVASVALGEPERILWALGSAAGAFGLFFIIFIAAPGKLGFGDVRLVVPIGIFTGFIDPMLVLWALILGSALGVLAGALSALRGARGHFAFGPALVGGALLSIWFAPNLV